MLVAVIGDRGLFGREMYSLLLSKGDKVVGFNRSNLDLSQSWEELTDTISRADVLINAVAYTQVDAAEKNKDEARLVNGEYAGKLARVAKALGAKFVQISTDYVFSGDPRVPLSIDSPTSPINEYGASKLLGEQLVADSGADYQIFRTAWLYGAGGNCFPRTIAKRLLEGGAVEVASDQVGQPTWSRDLAQVIYSHIHNPCNERVVHAVSSGSASWFEFAEVIASSLPGSHTFSIKPIASSRFIEAAVRPAYSVLDNTGTAGPIIGNWLDRWKVAAPEILSSIQKLK
jgi:dTDP-4-dehydrorhamnose reductase